MSVTLRVQLETYREVMGLATSANVLGESNRFLVECVLNDINNLISYSIYNRDDPGPSLAVEYLADNASRNQETLDNDRINDINYVAGMLATDVLAACLQVGDFFSSQIDVDNMRFNELRLGESATVRFALEHAYDIDEAHTPDATRMISGFFMLYRCGGENGRELRNEIRGTFDGYIGTATRDN